MGKSVRTHRQLIPPPFEGDHHAPEVIELFPDPVEERRVAKTKIKPTLTPFGWFVMLMQKLSILVMVCGFIWLYGLLQFVELIPTEQTRSEQKVDAAVVLTGGSKRIQHGFSRVSNKLAGVVFISGVNDEATPAHIVEQVKRESRPIPNEQIKLGYKARSTIGNAEEVQRYIIENNISSIRLITANYHMPRSLHEFSLVLPHAVQVVPDPVFPKGFDITRWKEDSNSRRLVMSEYHKYIASYVRHLFVRMQIP